jgi:hypothetical protein
MGNLCMGLILGFCCATPRLDVADDGLAALMNVAGRSEARRSYDLRFAGTAYLSLTGDARNELQKPIKKLSSAKSAIELPRARQPQWVRPELIVRVHHLAGGDTLRHATVKGLVWEKCPRPSRS